jgi:predicted anti-sigma-YlaC factor YlaD
MGAMSECDEFRELTADRDPAEDARLQRHAARCSHCREQLETDRELRQMFQGVARPGPSLHFNRELRKRLRAERQLQRRYRWRLLVMQGYWAAASVASAFVIMLIRWPGELPSVPVMCSFGAVFGMALLTPLILFLSLRMGPMNLILNTMNAFRR